MVMMNDGMDDDKSANPDDDDPDRKSQISRCEMPSLAIAARESVPLVTHSDYG
jgi:hypothetical protein